MTFTQVSNLETNVAQIGEKLASLIDMVSASGKSDKDKGGKSKITKELLPLVSIMKYNVNYYNVPSYM